MEKWRTKLKEKTSLFCEKFLKIRNDTKPKVAQTTNFWFTGKFKNLVGPEI